MEHRNFEPVDHNSDNIRAAITSVRETSNDALESIGQGFAFPVPQKIRDMGSEKQIRMHKENSEGIPVRQLLQTTLRAMKSAWEESIRPIIGDVRNTKTANNQYKEATDFFTQADVDSEAVIKITFNAVFGEDKIQIFGEEAGAYTGNTESRISVRIDPIDGTVAFKDGKPNWGIMVGVYEGAIGEEEQIIGAVLFPEIHALMYSVKEYRSTFVCDLDSGETKEVQTVSRQDSLKGILVHFYKHHVIEEQGQNESIHEKLEAMGVHLRTADSTCSDVLLATVNDGRLIMIYDGGLNPVDFIPFAGLERLGYTIYGWDGTKYHADDSQLENRKIIVVPPGLAGETVLEVVKSVRS